jgi:hypothetical protein
MMARDRAFIVPVCLDATPGAGTDVPESFHRVQWTRLPAGETPPAFAERVRRLLSPAQDHAPTAHPAAPSVSDAILTARRPFRGLSLVEARAVGDSRRRLRGAGVLRC